MQIPSGVLRERLWIADELRQDERNLRHLMHPTAPAPEAARTPAATTRRPTR